MGAADPLPQAPAAAHLRALRSLVLGAGAAVLAATLLAFAAMPGVFDPVVLGPSRPGFATHRLLSAMGAPPMEKPLPLVNISLASQFTVHMETSLWLGAALALPVVLALAWRFLAPALYSGERRTVALALAGAGGCFYAGAAAGFMTVVPLTVRFLADYTLSPAVGNIVSLQSYVDTVGSLTLLAGLVAELPVAAWLLGRLGILDRRFFRRRRRHTLVALMVLAAVITPTGDPLTLAAVILPLWLLWEAAALTVPAGRPQRPQRLGGQEMFC